jgi:hypothetical protein
LEPGPKPARDPRRPVQCERNKEGSKKYPSPKQSILWLDSALGPQCTCGVYAARVTTPSRRLPSIPTFVWSRSTRATDRSAHSPTGQLFEVFFQTRDGERRRSGCSFRAARPRTHPACRAAPLVVSPVRWLGSVSAAPGHPNGCARLMMMMESPPHHSLIDLAAVFTSRARQLCSALLLLLTRD